MLRERLQAGLGLNRSLGGDQQSALLVESVAQGRAGAHAVGPGHAQHFGYAGAGAHVALSFAFRVRRVLWQLTQGNRQVGFRGARPANRGGCR